VPSDARHDWFFMLYARFGAYSSGPAAAVEVHVAQKLVERIEVLQASDFSNLALFAHVIPRP
jgi:hypothetical protein